MGGAAKGVLKASRKAAALAAVQSVLTSPVPTFGLPKGLKIQTNSNAVTRFPLPATIGSALLLAIGIAAAMRGHRIIGMGLVGVGMLGMAGSAAAPELVTAIKKTTGAS